MSKDCRRIQAEHLKRLLNEMQISQNKLANELEKTEGINILPQQRISKILRGEGQLQYYQAEAIHRLFPQYRIPWLLGIDLFATEDELQEAEAVRHKNRSDTDSVEMNELLRQLAKRAGYKFHTLYGVYSVRGMKLPETGGDFAKFSLSRGNHRVELSPDTVASIESELIRYAKFIFWEIMNEIGSENNGEE